MKALLRLLAILLLAAVFAGCNAQKAAMNAGIDGILHDQALKALEQGSFFIVANEFELYDHDRTPRKKYSRPTDVISMRNGKVVIKRVYDLQSVSSYYPFAEEWNVVKATAGEVKKNGDTVFDLQIRGGAIREWERKITIILYAGINKCYVRLGDQLSFNGHVFPASTEVLRDMDINGQE